MERIHITENNLHPALEITEETEIRLLHFGTFLFEEKTIASTVLRVFEKGQAQGIRGTIDNISVDRYILDKGR